MRSHVDPPNDVNVGPQWDLNALNCNRNNFKTHRHIWQKQALLAHIKHNCIMRCWTQIQIYLVYSSLCLFQTLHLTLKSILKTKRHQCLTLMCSHTVKASDVFDCSISRLTYENNAKRQTFPLLLLSLSNSLKCNWYCGKKGRYKQSRMTVASTFLQYLMPSNENERQNGMKILTKKNLMLSCLLSPKFH